MDKLAKIPPKKLREAAAAIQKLHEEGFAAWKAHMQVTEQETPEWKEHTVYLKGYINALYAAWRQFEARMPSQPVGSDALKPPE